MATIAIALAAIGSAGALTLANKNARTSTATGVTPSSLHGIYPVGRADHSQPSGLAPPGPHSLSGFRQIYVSNFGGTRLPSDWYVFTGKPGGSPDGQFARAHIVVRDGLLRLNTWRDPAYGNKWVTGGLCQCGLTQIYGAYFVRSRVTGGGANEVQLLWPAKNTWPPEIDFNETGGYVRGSTATLHYGGANLIVQTHVYLDVTKWHTWGVIWTPHEVVYVVDGKAWGGVDVADEIPTVKMRLDLEQRTQCSLHAQCPKAPVSMLVDWVAVYALTTSPTVTTSTSPTATTTAQAAFTTPGA